MPPVIRAAALLTLIAAGTASAQATDGQARIGPPPATGPSYFVVLNTAGPNFAKAAESVERVRAHQALYRRFETEGQLIVGGSLAGATPLGVSVFCPGVDRAAVRATLENDQIVKDGVLALEFREWRIQMGSLANRCSQPG
ncbi:MAG: hypothetical protein DI570_09865 [Phenylobacterium zucineum]|nr:MAG: hypothetical protein DI570_09865 [Phenylobacterium zucineum]